MAVRLLLLPYRPLVKLFVRCRWLATGLVLLMLATGGLLLPRLGSEFMPRLDEGELLIRATMSPSISLEEARSTMLRFEKRLLAKFPEVTKIVTRVGRGEIGAHADPVNSAEAFVALKPKAQWISAATPEELYALISKAFEDFPGAQFNVTQPIAAAVDELLTGTKAELAIKIFGDDMEVLKEKAAEVETAMRQVPGAADVQKDQVTGTPQLLIRIDRQAIARYGSGAAQDPDEIYWNCAPAVFHLDAYDADGAITNSGSCFFIEKQGVAVTCYQIIAGATSASITVPDSTAVKRTPILSRMIPAKMRKKTNTFRNVSAPCIVPKAVESQPLVDCIRSLIGERMSMKM